VEEQLQNDYREISDEELEQISGGLCLAACW
jgi:bacteriocin-like protein